MENIDSLLLLLLLLLLFWWLTKFRNFRPASSTVSSICLFISVKTSSHRPCLKIKKSFFLFPLLLVLGVGSGGTLRMLLLLLLLPCSSSSSSLLLFFLSTIVSGSSRALRIRLFLCSNSRRRRRFGFVLVQQTGTAEGNWCRKSGGRV